MSWKFFFWVKTILMSRDAFCPITHQFIKWGKITRAGFTLPPKCRKEIVLSPVAIFASPLKISISGWAHFALMTPEQLLQAAERFSDTGGWRDMLQKRERVNKECIDVCECSTTTPPPPPEQSEDRSNNGPPCGNGSVRLLGKQRDVGSQLIVLFGGWG